MGGDRGDEERGEEGQAAVAFGKRIARSKEDAWVVCACVQVRRCAGAQVQWVLVGAVKAAVWTRVRQALEIAVGWRRPKLERVLPRLCTPVSICRMARRLLTLRPPEL